MNLRTRSVTKAAMADLDQENQGPGDNAVTHLQVKVDKLSSLMERFMTRPEPVVQQNTGASSVALGPTNVFIPPATLGQAGTRQTITNRN